jgi:hypothetical protein
MWKKILFFLLMIVAVLAGGLILIGALMVFTVPSAEDARVSQSIYNNFVEAAKTNISTNTQVSFISSPKRGETQIIITGNLSKDEERVLQAIAENIQTNRNRKIGIIFRR